MAKDFERNVLVAVFNVESEGYQALSQLRQAAGGENYLVSAAALVRKEENACYYLDGFDTGANTANDAVKGGLIGMLVGIIGGPLGMLLGGSYGTLIGMTLDAGDAALGASMLDQIADKLDDGCVAIVALTGEATNDDLDAFFAKFGAVVARFDAEAVADEVDRAYEAQYEAARLEKMQMEKEWNDQARKDIQESIEQGTEKFKDDLSFTVAQFKELSAEHKAKKQAQKEQREKDFEEASEILRKGFSK